MQENKKGALKLNRLFILRKNIDSLYCLNHAAMAELVDALDSGSSQGNLVDVRVILAAISKRTIWSLQTR